MNKSFEEAVLQGQVDQVRMLLGDGTDVNSLDRHSQTALMVASHRGYVEVARLLIDHGADLNTTAKYGLTALMLAIVAGHDETARVLVEAGADLEVRGTGTPGFYDRTALDLARDGGRTVIAEMIRARQGSGDVAE